MTFKDQFLAFLCVQETMHYADIKIFNQDTVRTE